MFEKLHERVREIKESREELADAKSRLSLSENTVRSLIRCMTKSNELAKERRSSQRQHEVKMAELRATARQLANQERENQRKIESLRSSKSRAEESFELTRERVEKPATTRFRNEVSAAYTENVEWMKRSRAFQKPVQVKVDGGFSTLRRSP